MARVISIHEYRLKEGVTGEQFEAAVEAARDRELFELPGLIDYHFLKRIRGTKQVRYCAIWIYESRAAWENIWGSVDRPVKKEEYPEKWRIWEGEILVPLLLEDPDQITHAAFEEF